MKRFFLLAPAAAFALLSIAAPVGAQPADLRAEMISVRAEARANHRDFLKLQRCDTPQDPVEIQRVSETAASIAQQAGALALRVPTKDHVQMLGIRDAAELDSWLVWQQPEKCYQPPAE